ncbi:MAG: ABC transporter permease [Ilumatobacteraceae bacterium]
MEEFRTRPFGAHSADLQHLLELMRSQPIAGKHFLFMSKTQEQWILGRYSTDQPLRPLLDWSIVFTNLVDAEWHVFKIRWNSLFEQDPIDD